MGRREYQYIAEFFRRFKKKKKVKVIKNASKGLFEKNQKKKTILLANRGGHSSIQEVMVFHL